MKALKSHLRAGTGAVCVETREESRLLDEIKGMADGTGKSVEIRTMAAPAGSFRDPRTGKIETGTMAGAYTWASAGPGRVLVVYDWHLICNNAGQWRGLIDALPGIRSPKGPADSWPSLVVFVGPSWDIQNVNPLKGILPVLDYASPSRADLREVAESLAPLNGYAELVADALCGLTMAAAEQAAAECLEANGGKWNTDHLREARRRMIRDAGLEIWQPVKELGGLAGIKNFATTEVVPWVRDPMLSVRRILCAGVPGVGKSFAAKWLADLLKCECVRLNVDGMKRGIVGESGAALRRGLSTIDSLGAEAPIVVVIDEIDTIAREGMDGGTSSGMFAELLTWLQESTSQAVVWATLNHLTKLDAALESRFQARFFFDLPTETEREAVACIHYGRLGCDNADDSGNPSSVITAQMTEGFSSREIAEFVCPSVARLSRRKPTESIIRQVCEGFTPASQTQADQLAAMRKAASSLRRANDPESASATGRRIAK